METGARDTTAAGESSGICCYQRHPCSRPRYQKYKFCVQHVLEDTSSPFTSCGYISRTSGRKCPNPALRSQRVNNLHALCKEHLRELIVKEQHQKQKKKWRKKRKSGKTAEKNSAFAKKQKLIDQLARYNKNLDEPAKESSDSEVEEVHRPITDNWPLDTEDLGSNADWDDFDPVNNEVYEPLRYADVLTPEEVVATAQSKLIRLQSLYIEQFKRLFHLLKERRRQYLYERKRELAGHSSEAQGDWDGDETEENYALATYRRRTGVEALLRKKQLKRRQEADGSTSSFKPSVTTSRCSHTSNHARCKECCLPYTKYCRLHILSDPHQQLYRKCHTKNCQNPVCILTARVYESDAKSEDEEPEEIYFCSLHAPLSKFTFKFPEPVTEEEEMVVDVETAGEVAEEAPSHESEELQPKVAPSEVQVHEEDDTQPIQNDDEAMEVEQTTKISSAESVVPLGGADVSEQTKTVGTDAKQEASTLHQPSEGTYYASTDSVESCLPPTEEILPKEDMTSDKRSPSKPVTTTSVTHCQSDGTADILNPQVVPLPAPTTDSTCKELLMDSGGDGVDLNTNSIAGKSGSSELSTTQPSPASTDEKVDASPASYGQPDEVAATESGPVDLSKGPEQEDVIDLSVQKHEDKAEATPAPGSSEKDEKVRLPAMDSPIPPMYLSGRGERKPSSAEEELAVVSLLSLCSGHPSDDNTPSSSTEQE